MSQWHHHDNSGTNMSFQSLTMEGDICPSSPVRVNAQWLRIIDTNTKKVTSHSPLKMIIHIQDVIVLLLITWTGSDVTTCKYEITL